MEKLKDFRLLHGECVAVGMAAAGFISWKRGLLDTADLEKLTGGLRAFSLPETAKGLEAGKVVETTRSDKKREAGSIKFVLLRRMGEAFVDRTVREEELLEAVSWILEDR